MSAAEPLLRVRGLRKRFGARVALAGIDLDVARGEIFGLLGPNGAGKTTVFRALTGLVRKDGGDLWLTGERVVPESRSFRRRIGVLFQDPSLDLKLTARENLKLGAALHGLPRRLADARIDAALALVALQERAHEPMAQHSGGMRRRIEMARVLLHEPDLLFLDEPGKGIDPATLRRIWDELRARAHANGTSAIVTTHQPDEAERCDRIAILNAGAIVATGSPDELRARVTGDVVQVRTKDGAPGAAAVLHVIQERLGLTGAMVGDCATIESGGANGGAVGGSANGGSTPALPGHALVPRIAELFPPGHLASVAVRRPDLADVFAKLTGQRIDEGTAGRT